MSYERALTLAMQLATGYEFNTLYDYLLVVNELAWRIMESKPIIGGTVNVEAETEAPAKTDLEAKAKLHPRLP